MADTFNLSSYVPIYSTEPHYELGYGFGVKPSINYGASKLISRAAQLLLTLKGSDKTDPQAGCNLLNLIGNSHTSEREFIKHEVEQMLQDIRWQMANEIDPNASLESQFRDINVDNIVIQDDRILLYFTITSATSELLHFQFPVKTQ